MKERHKPRWKWRDLRRLYHPKPYDKITLIVLAVFVLALYGFSSPVNWSMPIRATVIDEETGKPIPGAAVAGIWWVASMAGPHAVVMFRATSGTDGRGKFHLSGMPPRVRPPLTWFQINDPDLFVYAPGYRTVRLTNLPLAPSYAGPFDTRSPWRRSYWNGRVIALARANTSQERKEALSSMMSYVEEGDMKPNEFPRLWESLAAGWDRLPPEVRDETFNPRQLIDSRAKRKR
jgi:hypothetical protein